MESFRKTWPIHLSGSLLFLSLAYLTSPERNIPDFYKQPMFLKDLIQFTLLLVFFYLNYYWVVPTLYLRKKYLLFGLIMLAICLLIAYVPGIIIETFLPGQTMPPPLAFPNHFPRPRPGNFFFSRINHNIFLFIAVATVSLLLRINRHWKEAEKKRMEAELSFLKSQVNPHFLFNSLNSIYALAIQKKDNAATSIQQLSSMMRYMLVDSQSEKVSLAKELEYIQDYITLQKIRLGESLPLQVNIHGATKDLDIAPLLLIPFIENCFKYGVNPEEESDIQIQIVILGDRITLHTRNTIVQRPVMREKKLGIGLENTRNRLMLEYPGKHQLDIQNNNKEFLVTLIIELR